MMVQRRAAAMVFRRYALAVLLVSGAVTVTRLLEPVIAPHTSPPYFVAVMFASLFGGTGPGLLTTILSSFALAYFDLGSTGRLDLGGDDVVRLTVFILSAFVISSVNASRKKAEGELRRVIDQLAAVDRAKDEFIATVSHELRTPLASILGWSAILRDQRLDTDTLTIGISSIESSARTQAMLVDDLVDASRIVLKKMELQREAVEVTAVIQEAIDTVRPAADAKMIQIVTKFGGRVVVSADRQRLKQVIWNLLANAVKFTGDGGRIVVSLQSEGPSALIRVEDNGDGIPSDLLPHVFERFRQSGDGARKGGLGLGLSIAKHIIDLHGGNIEAWSEGPGRGAAFTIRMPLIASTVPPHRRSVTNDHAAGTPAFWT